MKYKGISDTLCNTAISNIISIARMKNVLIKHSVNVKETIKMFCNVDVMLNVGKLYLGSQSKSLFNLGQGINVICNWFIYGKHTFWHRHYEHNALNINGYLFNKQNLTILLDKKSEQVQETVLPDVNNKFKHTTTYGHPNRTPSFLKHIKLLDTKLTAETECTDKNTQCGQQDNSTIRLGHKALV